MSKRIFPMVLIFLTCFTVSAQTINFKLGAHTCNAWNGSYNCAGIPITNVDGSQPVPANASPATIQSFVLYNTRLNGVWFEGNYGLGNGVNGGANVTSYTVTDLQTTPASSRIDIEVAGMMLDGTHTYAGMVSYVYSVGLRHCSGGRGGGCSTPWAIAGGSGTLTVMTPQSAGPTASLSPIAPTPTCLPPNCPAHDSGKFVLASLPLHLPRIHAYIPPGCLSAPISVTPISPPFTCGGGNGVIATCQVFKGLCRTSDEYAFYSPVYWTQTWWNDYN